MLFVVQDIAIILPLSFDEINRFFTIKGNYYTII